MKRSFLLALCSLLVGCQSPMAPVQSRFVPPTQMKPFQRMPLQNMPLQNMQRMQADSPDNEHATKHLHSHYPIEAGRRWMYDLELTKNGTSLESRMMNVFTQALPPGYGGESRAVLRRMYSNSSDQAPLTTVSQFTQHVELAHTGQTVREAFAADFATLKQDESQVKVTALRLPLRRGQKWEGRRFRNGVEKVSVLGNERIAVPAGYFDATKLEHCLQYTNGRKDYLYYWYVPSVGVVKFEEQISIEHQGRWQTLRAEGSLLSYVDPSKQQAES